MRAVVQSGYGEPAAVLAVAEVAPPEPAADEVLVRVQAASVHADVWHVILGLPYVLRLMGSGLRRPSPTTPGTDLAGVVEAVGHEVDGYDVGDEVFGEALRGMQWKNGGTWAELATVPASGLAPKPPSASFEQAACLPTAGLIVLQNLARVGALDGRKVLVNGAAGGVGSIGLQIAKARGAEVTGVDRTEVLDRVHGLGADHVVDFTAADATRLDERFDLVFDIPGNHPLSAWERVLEPEGRYILIGHDGYGEGNHLIGSMAKMLGLVVRSPVSKHLAVDYTTPDKGEQMAELAALVDQGALTAHVERTYPLEGAAEAIEHLTSGRATGRLLLVP